MLFVFSPSFREAPHQLQNTLEFFVVVSNKKQALEAPFKTRQADRQRHLWFAFVVRPLKRRRRRRWTSKQSKGGGRGRRGPGDTPFTL